MRKPLVLGVLVPALLLSACSASPSGHHESKAPSTSSAASETPSGVSAPAASSDAGWDDVKGISLLSEPVEGGVSPSVVLVQPGSSDLPNLPEQLPNGVQWGSNQPGDLSALFSTGYVQMVATKTMSDGSRHAGVVLENSAEPTFLDISAPLQTSSFSGAVSAEFAQIVNDRFYFMLRPVGGGASKVYSVDLNTWTSDKATAADYRLEKTLDADGSEEAVLVSPDGSITSENPAGATIGRANGKYTWNSSGMIGSDHYLWVDSVRNTLWSFPVFASLADAPNAFHPEKFGKQLLPATSRSIKSAIVSADGKSIAFFAQQGSERNLYTVSSSGGDPEMAPGGSWDPHDQLVAWH